MSNSDEQKIAERLKQLESLGLEPIIINPSQPKSIEGGFSQLAEKIRKIANQ